MIGRDKLMLTEVQSNAGRVQTDDKVNGVNPSGSRLETEEALGAISEV